MERMISVQLLTEIDIINTSGFGNVIFIDDARLFLSPPPGPCTWDAWPSIGSILEKLQDHKHRRYVVIIQDVIIAVPIELKQVLASWCQESNAKEWADHGKAMREDNLPPFRKGLLQIWNGIRLILWSTKRKLKSVFYVETASHS